MGEFAGWAGLSTVALIGLLVSEWQGSNLGRGTFKFIASAGFLGAAVVVGAFDVLYGWILLVGMAFSWAGDMLLLSRKQHMFLLGLLSFFFAHVAFSLAFLTVGHHIWASVVTYGVLAVTGAVALWHIMPGMPSRLRLPVCAYATVVTLMVSLAAGAFWNGANYIMVSGAVLFYFSDLFVARDRFISESYINSLVGLPLYYAAQFMLAFSVSTL